jgi:hypothetical protein
MMRSANSAFSPSSVWRDRRADDHRARVQRRSGGERPDADAGPLQQRRADAEQQRRQQRQQPALQRGPSRRHRLT